MSAVEIENVVELMAWLAARNLSIFPRRGQLQGLLLVALYNSEGEGTTIVGTGDTWLIALRSAIAKWEETHGVEIADAK